MDNIVNIKDPASLEQLRIAIVRFCEESGSILSVIDSKLQSRLESIKLLESYFTRNIENAQNDLMWAKSKTNIYKSSSSEYEEKDYDFERGEIYSCRAKVTLAENNYEAFKREIIKLENYINEYQNPKIKYRKLIEFEREAASSCLKQLINGAEDYLAVVGPTIYDHIEGLGLAENIAKHDPTMILATTFGIAEIIVMSMFSFLGVGGSRINVTNKKNKNIITTTFKENGEDFICSELKIIGEESGPCGKILCVNIPPSLQNEKVGRHLISNMEATCRANECKEISGWSKTNNKNFYKSLGYKTRNEINDAGAEVYKTLDSSFYSLQQNAMDSFEGVTNEDFLRGSKSLRQCINPLNILSPANFDDEIFWKQHEIDGKERYIQQIEGYLKCKDLIEKGHTLDALKKNDFESAIAYENFIYKEGGDTIRLQKSGEYYRVEGGGRHRVAAAQLYYLFTGEIIPLIADVIEKSQQ